MSYLNDKETIMKNIGDVKENMPFAYNTMMTTFGAVGIVLGILILAPIVKLVIYLISQIV